MEVRKLRQNQLDLEICLPMHGILVVYLSNKKVLDKFHQ